MTIRFLSRWPATPPPMLVVGEGPAATVLMSALAIREVGGSGVPTHAPIAQVATESEAWRLLGENPRQTVVMASAQPSDVWADTLPGITILSAADVIANVTGAMPLSLASLDPELHRLGPVKPLPRAHRLVKRAIDLVFALGVGVVFLLLLPLLALAIRLESQGPVFYRQTRIGLGNRPFTIVKLRTMRVDAERDGAQWTQVGDPRITRVGAFLRRARIDELPQVWNILRGDMTLVGPRPERPEFTRQLEQSLPFYAKRHAVKPGLTGWAQVRYRYASSVHDAAIKLEHDLYYVKRLSLRLDLQILLRTVQVVLRLRGR